MSSKVEGQAIIEVTEEVTIIETSVDINSPIYAEEARASAAEAKASEVSAAEDAQATAADRTYIDGQVDHVDGRVDYIDSQVAHVNSQAAFTDGRADDAANSASDAAASETNAAQSENSAQEHLNAFLDRYYGDYATPPAVSPTGNAPEVGDLYFDTTEGALKIWTSAGWRNATTVVEGVYDVHEYRNQAGNDSFTLDYDVGLLQVLYNGVQLASDDFTADNGTSVTLAQPVTKATDVITLIRWGAVTQATFIGTAAQKDVEDFDPAGAAAQAEANAKSYTDMEIASLVAAAPGALDTLNELAQALGDDPNFATTMTNALGQKLDASTYNAADVLAKLLTVDGAGTGLNADLVDGAHAADLRDRSTHTGTQPLSTISDAGTAAAANVGTGADDVPKTSQADARYARLSGANNFDTMPTVNGASIVESDSNSDGEWAKFSDGTALIRGMEPEGRVTSASGSVIWTYPISLVSRALVAAESETTANTQVRNYQPTEYGVDGQSHHFYLFDGTGSALTEFAIDGRLFFSGHGRWK
ncbi:hypothetical protein [Halomonas sp. BN3-1]|uniref:hypothetical protein n=1 Tax=Halomonas sp. BN3-1 TaxID=2082393 RepID=UPI001963C16D|nr:hypothetical protein [Halomonas sp. BN3-1]